MLVKIAKGKTLIRLLLQKQSDLGLYCLPMLATSVLNFRTITLFGTLYVVKTITIKLSILANAQAHLSLHCLQMRYMKSKGVVRPGLG